MIRLASLSGLTLAALSAVLIAAPGTKDKEPPLGPIKPEQRKQSFDNLQQMGLAFHDYHDVHGQMPTNQIGQDKQPLLSWRVQILPYVEQEALYKQFKLDEAWDSDHNIKLIAKIPPIFAPVRGRAKEGETFYQGFNGQGMLRSGVKISLATIVDGTSNTFMVAEAGKPVIWTKPEDMPFDGKKVPELGGMFDGSFTAVMADGAARKFRKGLDADYLKRLIDPQDGQPVNPNDGADPDAKE